MESLKEHEGIILSELLDSSAHLDPSERKGYARDTSPHRGAPGKWNIANLFEKPGPWFGGKTQGRIRMHPTYCAYSLDSWVYGNFYKAFRFDDYGGRENALLVAQAFVLDYCNQRGITKNQKRLIGPGILEVQVGLRPMLIDEHNSHIIDGSVWGWSGEEDNQYVCRKKKTRRLHKVLLTAPPGFIIDHIDRNPANNLMRNLRIVTRTENNHNMKLNRRNKTGIPGVSRQVQTRKNSTWIFWRATYNLDKKVHYRSFLVKNGNEEAARASAIAFRKKGDLLTGSTNGKPPSSQ
jgi:hypothetical protein